MISLVGGILKTQIQKIENRMVVARDQRLGKWGDVGQRVQLEVKNKIKTYKELTDFYDYSMKLLTKENH